MFLILNLSAYNSDNIKNKNLVTTQVKVSSFQLQVIIFLAEDKYTSIVNLK